MTQISHENRAARNAAYLKKVLGTDDLGEARDRLESKIADQRSGGFGDLQVAKPGDDNERDPLESLDILQHDPTGSILTDQDHDRLEAIIHETGRPAFIIDNGSFVPSGEWAILGQGDARKNIEAAIPSVGRIEVPRDFRPYAGTGMVVGENLLMTNRHVARIFASGIGTKHVKFDSGQIAGIDFLRELPAPNKPDPVFLEIKDIVMIHPYWDMALLRTKADLTDKHPPLKLSVKTPEEFLKRKVVVIGYPAKDYRNNLKVQEQIFGGRYQIKRLLPGEHDGATTYRGQDVMAHDTSTLGGSSGSAVLDIESGDVIGLHYAGEYMVSNYAVPTLRLAEDKRVVGFGLNFAGTASAKTSFYAQHWEKADNDEAVIVDIKEQKDTHEGGPPPAVDPHISKFDFASLQSAEFSWRAALSTALASHIAYFDEVQVQQACELWQLEKCHFIARDDTECFVAGNNETTIVAFRGTQKKIADWLTDLNAWGTTMPYGRVHRGFWAAFQSVAAHLKEAIADFGSPTLVLTGHSLGGALALIAAAEWKDSYNVRSIYTYGQPAVGKGRFPEFMRTHYGSVFYRFVNDDDIVPKVPPTYRHIGQLYHFGSGKELQEKTESFVGAEDTATMSEVQFDRLRLELLNRRLKSNLVALETEEGWIPSFRDHSMARYVGKIAENME